MESLYSKYRPQTFEDVVGQAHVVETLERAVREQKTSHAYLFCGPRGTGKTTLARILAKALLCDKGPGELPDGSCEQCQLVAQGEHPDVFELDAASRTGVDSVREEIIASVAYAPVRGAFKIYIIDEVHMLTTQAFNALLKTLEEPPAHVVFVLCTTDPQRIPETILSRVQRFDFHAISDEELCDRLVYVCEQEGFTYDDAALDLIVRHARGGMRDALSSLDQLSVFGSGTISHDAARDMLGTAASSKLATLSEAIAQRDIATLFAEVASSVAGGQDLLQLTRELAGRMRDVYVMALTGGTQGLVRAGDDELPKLKHEAELFGSADRLSRALAILGDAANEMRTAPDQRLSLEIALARIARPQVDISVESLAERVAELEAQLTGASAATASAAGVPMPAAATESATVQPIVTAEQEPVAAVAASELEPVRPSAASEPATPAAESVRRQAEPSVDLGTLQRNWRTVVDGLLAEHPHQGTLLMNAVAHHDDGQTLEVMLPKGSSFAKKMLERQDVRSVVEAAVAQAFGPHTLIFNESDEAADSAAFAGSRAAQASEMPAVQAIAEPAAPQAAAPTVPAAQPEQAPESPTPQPQTVPQPDPQNEPHAAEAPQEPQAQTLSKEDQAIQDLANFLNEAFEGEGQVKLTRIPAGSESMAATMGTDYQTDTFSGEDDYGYIDEPIDDADVNE